MHYEKLQDGTIKCIEDEIPFDIPDNWSWSRIAGLCTKITDGTHHSPENYPSGDYMYVTAKNIKENGIILDDITFVSKEVHDEIFSRCNPEKGDVLYIKDGATSGVATINNLDEEFSLLSSVALLKPSPISNNWFLCYIMQSPYFYATTRGDMKGVGITRVTLTMINSRLVPVAPFNEQKRIVDCLQQAIPKLQKLSEHNQEIMDLIGIAKTKILDMAIRGELVPQNPNDEPAAALLSRIRAEKEELIKGGKLKRDKKESIIYKGDDNSYYEQIGTEVTDITESIPFQVPDNWEWCRLKCLSAIEENAFVDGPFGSNLKTEHYTTNEEVRIVQLNNIGVFEWKDAGKKYTTYAHAQTISRCISKPGDLVIAKMMPAGRTIILPSVNDTFVISSDCVRLRSNSLIDKEYLLYMLNSPCINTLVMENVQGIGRTRTSLNKMKELLVPVPPISMQVRIVAVIKQMFAQLHNIEYSIA